MIVLAAEFGDTVERPSAPVGRLPCCVAAFAILALLGFLIAPAAAQAGPAQRMPGDGECAAARHTGQPAPRGRENRRGRDHLCRPLDLLHRHARRRADRDRLQRRLPDRPPARRRHHEPRPLHALHAVPRPAHSACAARLGRGRRSRRRSRDKIGDVFIRNVTTDIRRYLRRRYRRRHDQGRQLDLHLRGRRALHRPSRPSASSSSTTAISRRSAGSTS